MTTWSTNTLARKTHAVYAEPAYVPAGYADTGGKVLSFGSLVAILAVMGLVFWVAVFMALAKVFF